MAIHQRENSHVVRLTAYRSRVREQRSFGQILSWGISIGWRRLVRSLYCVLGGQKGEVNEGRR